jgi:hypothetical protein
MNNKLLGKKILKIPFITKQNNKFFHSIYLALFSFVWEKNLTFVCKKKTLNNNNKKNECQLSKIQQKEIISITFCYQSNFPDLL